MSVDIITIHQAPDPRLSPNARTPGRTVSRLRAQLRRDVALTTSAALDPERRKAPPEKARLYVAVFWGPRRRTWDDDNLRTAMKAVWDGLVDGGAIAGDDPRRLEPPTIVQHKAEPGHRECIYIEVRNAETDELRESQP